MIEAMVPAAQKVFKILTPIGLLGYGFPAADFWRGMEEGADAIVVDAGSSDPGPYMLGLGKMIVSMAALERDLRIMLAGAVKHKVPLLIGSAGGPGIGAHVDATVELIRTIAQGEGYKLKVAAIYADVSRELVRERFKQGRITPCAGAPELTALDIDESVNIVAQMGEEPFLEVFRQHPDIDVIVAGRAYDPAPYAALSALHGVDAGICWHMGKIMECGGACAEPKGSVIVASLSQDSFELEPMSPRERCTVLSVAAHTLYEKTRPDLLPGPGGVLDLTASQYEQLDERRVRVRGSSFHLSPKYQVKLEGAAIAGFRTIFIGGIRDPIFIRQAKRNLERVRGRLCSLHPAMKSGEARLHFHVYGIDGVMEELEPLKDVVPHEIGILGEITAATQELADAIASDARISVLHMPYEGQVATAGNLALPLNPPENPIGPVCRFSIYHLMEGDSPLELFPYRIVEI